MTTSYSIIFNCALYKHQSLQAKFCCSFCLFVVALLFYFIFHFLLLITVMPLLEHYNAISLLPHTKLTSCQEKSSSLYTITKSTADDESLVFFLVFFLLEFYYFIFVCFSFVGDMCENVFFIVVSNEFFWGILFFVVVVLMYDEKVFCCLCCCI